VLPFSGKGSVLNSGGWIRSVVEAGFECIQPMGAKTGLDLIEPGKAYGDRLAFMGNIDIRALETINPTRIEEEILPELAQIRKERIPYIFYSDHSI